MRCLHAILIATAFLGFVDDGSACRYYVPPPPTIRQNAAEAKVIIFGRIESSRHEGTTKAATDLIVHDVIKSHALVKDRKVIIVPRYIPEREEGTTNYYLVFADDYKGKLDVYLGIAASQRVVAWRMFTLS